MVGCTIFDVELWPFFEPLSSPLEAELDMIPGNSVILEASDSQRWKLICFEYGHCHAFIDRTDDDLLDDCPLA